MNYSHIFHESKLKYIRLQVCFLLLFFPGIFLSGQGIKFDHYDVESGLPQSVILKIHQDREGFIWLGTQSGLSRYNGYEFVNYFNDPTDENTISNAWIYDIAEDTEGNLYLATKGGLNKFDKKTESFSLIDHRLPGNTTPANFIYGIAADSNFLYINTPPFLSIRNMQTGELEVFQNDMPDPGSVYDQGSDILLSEDGKLWIASHNGLSSFDPEEKEFQNFRFGEDAPVSQNVTALFPEENGNILVGTEYGMYSMNPKSGKLTFLTDIRNHLNSIFIRDITRDMDNNLWIATEGNGLYKLRISKEYEVLEIKNYRSEQAFVSHDILYSLYVDMSNNLWVGSIKGLDKTDLKKSGIHTISNLPGPESYDLLDNIIASIFEDTLGRLWIGNWGTGLNILNANRDQQNILHYKSEYQGKYHIPENHVHVIFENSEGNIFIGTRNGVSVFDEERQLFRPVHEYFNNPEFDCFANSRAYCMMEDSRGRIWFGTGNGIIILNISENEVLKLRADSDSEFEINSNMVYSIMEDRDGEVWIATSEGINRFDMQTERMTSYRTIANSENSLCNNFTISLCEDKLGNIWIGTGSGLNRFSKNDSTFTYYSRSSGLPSEIIYNIIEDNKRNLWFTTGRGLVSINPDEADTSMFSEIDPLKGQEFNIKAIYKSKEGELFFGGMNGVYSFFPDSISKNLFVPPVKITSIRKENNGVLHTLNTYQDKIVLSYRDYAFTVEFAALDFTNPEKNNYSYRMIGLSDKWINLGERRFLHFTNLPPGNYTLMIRASNNDGIWNENPATLQITIKPPWWASNLAYIAYVILLLLLIVLIMNLRERNLRKEKKILEANVIRRTREIARQKQYAEESEQRLRSTVNSLDDVLFVLDEKGYLQEFYNPRQKNTHFIIPDKDIGKHFKEIAFPEDVIEQFNIAFENFATSAGIMEFDHHFTVNGDVFWYSTKISAKRSQEGRLTGLVIVAREITDRKEQEAKLARQKQELDELNNTKDKFFSILAHDLKNPFANLYSLGELLIKNYEVLDEEDKIEGLKKMHKSSAFIYELLENLLTWSRSQRGKIDYNPTNFDLTKITDINVNLHKIHAESKRITIKSELKEGVQVYGDREMINTVIRNLLNNAVKFTREGGEIIINVAEDKEEVIVNIKDTGVGISEEDQKKLFRLDDKYKSKGTAGESGTGLGLVLCKEFIEKNGGKIWCESRQGEGTTFSFRISAFRHFDSAQ
ncbi:MAG: PAS domain S-box protein [Bacteroidales bacterium]|nr:PAS domain S-box protein [Bacteroidales bacterium]MCF8392246.1 PAS domain S-box protein [Bacteroidales bacterium]